MSIVLFAATGTSLNREACRKTVEQSNLPMLLRRLQVSGKQDIQLGRSTLISLKHSDLFDVMHLPTVSVSSCTKKNIL